MIKDSLTPEQIEVYNAMIETKLKILCRSMGISELVTVLETGYGQTIVFRYSKDKEGSPLYQGLEAGMTSSLNKFVNKANLYG